MTRKAAVLRVIDRFRFDGSKSMRSIYKLIERNDAAISENDWMRLRQDLQRKALGKAIRGLPSPFHLVEARLIVMFMETTLLKQKRVHRTGGSLDAAVVDQELARHLAVEDTEGFKHRKRRGEVLD